MKFKPSPASRWIACGALLAMAATPLWVSAQETEKEANTGKPPVRDGKPEPEAPSMRTWMGIVTAGVALPVRRHLELPDGIGVEVEFVAEGSPAAASGLRPHDVLMKLDDQWLTTPEHLATLVRMKKAGDEVKLTLIRKGAEDTVKVTLGEMEGEANPEPFSFRVLGPRGEEGRWRFDGNFPALEDLEGMTWGDLTALLEKAAHHREEKPAQPRYPGTYDGRSLRGDEARPDSSSRPPQQNRYGADGPAPSRVPTDRNPQAGRPPSVMVQPGLPMNVMGGTGTIQLKNPHGEVTITAEDGAHEITVKDAGGKSVYQGAFDPEKGVSGLPKEAQAVLEEMKVNQLKLLDRSGGKDEEAGGGKEETSRKAPGSERQTDSRD